jgi:hypothetical protein
MAWAPNVPGSNAGNFTHSTAAFLRVFSGETVAAYNQATMIKDKLRSRNITSGKSAQFPTISTSSAKLHTPGDDLFGNDYAPTITNNETTILINKLLIDSSFVDDLDEMMAHYDARSEYAAQMGMALANAGDKWALGALTRGALASGTITTAGTYANAILGDATGSAVVKLGLQSAASQMDTLGVPKGDRYAVISPTTFYGLLADNDTMSSDFGKGGNRAAGDVGSLSYMGITLLSSGIWADGFMGAAGTEGAGEVLVDLIGNNPYDVALLKTWGVAFHKEAAGCVSLKGLSTETSWIPERQGNLVVTKQAIGVDILRPSSSILLKGA